MQENKIKVIEKPFSLKDIKKCKEAFLTSTTVKILPVIKVDDIEINNKKVGPITKKLTDEMYRKLP